MVICIGVLQLSRAALSMDTLQGFALPTINYQLPTVLTSSVFSSRLMSNVSCPHYNRCRAKRRQYVSPRLTLHLESLGNMRPDNTERREYVIITSIIP